MDTIESIKLNNVEVQANGIIRNEKGYLIGRLVGGVEYDGEHVKKLHVSSKTTGLGTLISTVPGMFTHVTPTQPDWISEFREKTNFLYNKEDRLFDDCGECGSSLNEEKMLSFIQKIQENSIKQGYKKRVQEEIDGVEETVVEIVQKEAVDTFRKRVEEILESLKQIHTERESDIAWLKIDAVNAALEEAKAKIREL